MSTVKVDNIEGGTGNTITVPSGQTFSITDGLSVASGGTGIASFTAGDIFYATGATTLTKLAKGTTEQTLKMNTAASVPEYGTTHPIAGGTGLTSYTSGDFLYADTTTSLAKLAKGSNDEVLTLASGVPTWAAAPAASGKVLQVVQTVFDDLDSGTNYGSSFASITGCTATITPAATTSKIWISANINICGVNYACYLRLQKGGVDISGALGTVTGSRVAITGYGGVTEGTDNTELQATYLSYLDSPSTTSATTYSVTIAHRHVGTWTVNKPNTNTDIDSTGHSISTITLMEIGV